MKSEYKSGDVVDFGYLPNKNLGRPHEKLTIAQQEILRKDAAKVQFSRNLRREQLDATILGEPAWDILLALFVIDNDKRRMSVGELARATGIPQTTTVRWVTELEERDLVRRRANPLDQRIVHVELAEKGRRSMESYFMLMRKAEVFS